MPPILRNILAILAGLLIGGVVNMAIVTVGPMLIPPPDGVDMTNVEKLAENINKLSPANFLAPWLAHALGTLVGAWVAATLAATRKMPIALGIGAFSLLGGIAAVAMIGGPLWFILLDLIGAYLPMGYLGGRLAGAKAPRPA